MGLAIFVVGACGGADGSPAPDAVIVAEGLRFDTDRIEVEAGEEFTLEVDNRDVGVFHNFHLTDVPGEPETALVAGPSTETLSFTLDEPGSYTFICDTHPAMRGAVEVVGGPR